MTEFFPIPTNVIGLWSSNGGHPTRSVRNEQRFHEIAAERERSRMIAVQWVHDAMHDGWLRTATYRHESIDTACTLERDGYKCSVIARQSRFEPQWTLGGGEVHVWAPDDLQIPVPLVYPGWRYFLDAVTTCPHCHRGPNADYWSDRIKLPSLASLQPVATKRYSFAGRACEACAPALRAATEKPGWND